MISATQIPQSQPSLPLPARSSPSAEVYYLREPQAGWTDERVELLKKLWADGFSASQIAVKMGAVTRCGVIGKVHRLGLPGRATTHRKAVPTRPRSSAPAALVRRAYQQARAIGKQAAAKHPVSQPRREIPPLAEAPESMITVRNITDYQCHWPIGDPMEQGFHFCGRRKGFGVPYCEHHAAIAYRPAWKRGEK